MIGVYVHFPWCLRKCPYCDFSSFATRREDVPHEAFAGAVIRELDRRLETGDWKGTGRLTVFVGGGTPSLWRPEALGRVLARLRELGELVEVTVESNPSSLDADVASRLAAAGVDRLSVGVQSLRARHLTFLGRLHDGPGALAALRAARAAVPHVSADLIAGMPDQTAADLSSDIGAVIDTGVEHVSVYTLTIEPGTPFGDMQRRGLLAAPSDDRLADLYETASSTLGAAGFAHYEISNWAKDGRECRHNRVYWEGGPYLGLGPGAFGFSRTGTGGVRYRNTLDPARYLARYAERRAANTAITPPPTSRYGGGAETDSLGRSDAGVQATGGRGGREPPSRDDWSEELKPADLVNEALLLGLRLREGIDLAAIGAELGTDAVAPRKDAIERLCRERLLEHDGPRLRIPEDTWLLADLVIRRLIV